MYKLLRKILLLGKKDPFILQSETKRQLFSKHNFLSDIKKIRKKLLWSALLGFVPFFSFKYPQSLIPSEFGELTDTEGYDSTDFLFDLLIQGFKYFAYLFLVTLIYVSFFPSGEDFLEPTSILTWVILSPIFLHLFLFKPLINYLRIFVNLAKTSTYYLVLFPEKLSQFEKDMLDKSKKIYEESVIKENANKEKAKVRAGIAAEKQKAVDSAVRKTRENLRKQFNNFIEENPIESELFLALKPFKDDSMPYNELVMFISNDNLILMPPKFDHIYSTIKEQVELELSNGKSTLLAIPLSQFPIHKIPLEAVVFYSVQGDFKRISKIVAMETTNVNFIENLGSFGGTKVHSVTEKHDDREVIFSFNNQQGKRTLIRFTSSVIDAFDKLIPDKVKIAGK